MRLLPSRQTGLSWESAISAIFNVHEAETHFSKLLDCAHTGEEIIVAKAGKPYARLVKIEVATPFKRVPGRWPELAPLADEAEAPAMTDADIDAWEQKVLDM